MPAPSQQVAGQAAETPAAASTAGFIGWTPEANRAIYKAGSTTKDAAATAAAAGGTEARYYR